MSHDLLPGDGPSALAAFAFTGPAFPSCSFWVYQGVRISFSTPSNLPIGRANPSRSPDKKNAFKFSFSFAVPQVNQNSNIARLCSESERDINTQHLIRRLVLAW